MNPRRALIGYTGFIGSYLHAHETFTDLYNSKNIDDIVGQHFDEVICAGASAEKWIANAEPDEDKKKINRLINCLRSVSADKFILVSTVDVFGAPRDVDETTKINTENLHSYGVHRFELERFIRSHFRSHTVLRLPAVFGPGLKKNALYDLLHERRLDQLPANGVFQWYNIENLPNDLRLTEELSLVHLVTEPFMLSELIKDIFPARVGIGCTALSSPYYDVRTVHAAKWRKSGVYISDKKAVLEELNKYVASTRLFAEREM